jgi:hypothetical protein
MASRHWLRSAAALLLSVAPRVALGQECSVTTAQQAAYRIADPSATTVDGLGLVLMNGPGGFLTGTEFARCAPGYGLSALLATACSEDPPYESGYCGGNQYWDPSLGPPPEIDPTPRCPAGGGEFVLVGCAEQLPCADIPADACPVREPVDLWHQHMRCVIDDTGACAEPTCAASAYELNGVSGECVYWGGFDLPTEYVDGEYVVVDTWDENCRSQYGPDGTEGADCDSDAAWSSGCSFLPCGSGSPSSATPADHSLLFVSKHCMGIGSLPDPSPLSMEQWFTKHCGRRP